MSSDKQVQQPIIRPNLVSDILNEQFESSSATRKRELSNNIKQLFFKYDGVIYNDIHEKIKEERAGLTQSKRCLKRLEKISADVKQFTTSETAKILALAADKNIVIPDTVDKLSYRSHILKLYEEKINAAKAEVERRDFAVKKYEETASQCGNSAKVFNKTHKKEYTEWKTGLLNEYEGKTKELKQKLKSLDEGDAEIETLEAEIKTRNKASPFDYLTSRLAEQARDLSPIQNEHYKLRIEKDLVANKMVRFGVTDKHLAHYATNIVIDFASNVFNNYVEKVATPENIRNLSFVYPPISVSHIDLSKFVHGPVCDLYRGLLAEQLRNSTSVNEKEKETKIYKAIDTYVRRTFKSNPLTSKCTFDDRFMIVLYRTVMSFIKFTSDIIADKVRKDGIKTFQEKIITSVFTYTFGVYNQKPYEVPKVGQKKK